MPRLILAFLVAPLLGLCGGALTTWLLFFPSKAVTLLYIPFMIIGGAFVTYPLLLVVAVPAFLLLRRSHVTALWVYVALGALLGLVGWIVASSPSTSALDTKSLSELAFGLSSGVLGATIFQRVVVQFGKVEAPAEVPTSS
jgi:nitrate/nitrite transporter NarK